ncbi:MAG: aspartyl protease family protein [Verrucomicrobiota bacterium]
MHPVYLLVVGLLGFSLTSLQSESAGACEYRTFKSRASGKEVRARLLSIEGKNAQIRTSAGQEVTIPIQALSVDDQAYIQAWSPDERQLKWLEDLSLSEFLRESGYTQTPFNVGSGKLTINVAVNQKPFEFLLDPGKFLTIFNRELADQVGVQPSEVVFGEFPLPDGSLEPVVGGVFKSFSLGQTHLEPWEMGMADLPKIGFQAQGILGADFFQLMGAMIDWQKRVAYCKAAETDSAEPEVGELREYATRSGSKMLGELVKVEGETVTLNVDGGKQLQLPISSLSDTDREYLDLWMTDPRRKGLGSLKISQILSAEGYAPVPYGYGNSTVAAFELELGTEKLRFLLNSTLPVSYLDRAAASRIGMSATPLEEFMLVDGKKTQLHLTTLNKLNTAGNPLPSVDVRIVDLNGANSSGAIPIRTCMIFRFPELAARQAEVDVDGILGLDAIRKLGALIDYEAQKMFVRVP